MDSRSYFDRSSMSFLTGLVAAIMTISAPLPAMGQSDETCVAYMEADAAYDEARKAAWRDAEKVGSKAYTAVMMPHRAKHMAAYRAADEAGFVAAKKAGGRCGGFFSRTETAAIQRACKAADGARRAVLDAYGVNDRAAEKQARMAEAQAILDFRMATDKVAHAEMSRAYRAAYGGPTSKVTSVMEKLIAADRERCRERLELHQRSKR